MTSGKNESKKLRTTIEAKAWNSTCTTENQQVLLSTNLYNSRDVEQSGRIELQCKDGSVFAHKNVLAAGSDYFRGMFSYGYKENETNTASFPDVTTEIMNIVIKFIYAQDIPSQDEISRSTMRETIIAANKMQLKDLYDIYWSLYSENITMDTFLNIWQLAEMFNEVETIKNVAKYVLTYLKKITSAACLSEITTSQLDWLITRYGHKLTQNQIDDMVFFLLAWVKSKEEKSGTNNHIGDFMKLISKFDVRRLSDSVLQSLVDDEVVKSTAIHNVLIREAICRWVDITKPLARIHVLEMRRNKCKNAVWFLETALSCGSVRKNNDWIYLNVYMNTPVNGNTALYIPAVDTTGNIFHFEIKHPSASATPCQIVACDAATGESYSKKRVNILQDFLKLESANANEICFRATVDSYSIFNLEKRKWYLLTFSSTSIEDCKAMLLAIDGIFFFDVDDRCIKIINIKLGTSEMKEKLPGSWEGVTSRGFDGSCSKKLIFSQNPSNDLLIYEIENDSWNVVCTPMIKFRVVLVLYWGEDCLIVEKAKDRYCVYSLNTMKKVTEYCTASNKVHFDISYAERQNANPKMLLHAQYCKRNCS